MMMMRPVLSTGEARRERANVRRWCGPWARTLLAFSLGVGLMAHAHAGEPRYRLGPEDKVRFKVFEWRASQDQVFEWKALNDDFTVSASGSLSLPLVGDVPVGGLSPEKVAQDVAERLRQRMGLATPPDVSIDVVQYRPFFVSGDVVHPGPYPYHPGLTVLQAVAIAGGISRSGDLGLARLSRELISGEGDMSQWAQEYDAGLARRARLQAEVSASTSISMPSEFANRSSQPAVTKVMEAETLIFDSHQRAFKTQSDALKELKAFLQKEWESLNAQLATIDTQMNLVNKELSDVSSLVEKGMVIAPRQLALQRSIAQIQGDRLSMQTSKLRVLEEISKADISLIQLRNTRITEAATELRETQMKLDELAKKSETGGKLLYLARATAPRGLAEGLQNGVLEPTYTLVRQAEKSTEPMQADEESEMQPGDTVKVTLPLPPNVPGDLTAAALSGAAAATR